MAQVIEVNSLDELDQHRLTWRRLFLETPGATFFHTCEWLEVYWRHFACDQRLKLLVIQLANETVGIVPLVVHRVPHRLATLRTVSYPLDDWGTAYSPIGPHQTASLMMAMGYLATNPRDWDTVELRSIRKDIDRGRTRRAMSLAGLEPVECDYQASSVVSTHGTWEDYLGTRDRKVRHEIVRQLRRADENTQLEFVRHRPAALAAGDGDPAWDLYDECTQVASVSWQAGAGVGNTLCNSQVSDFYREAHATAARLGMVDVAVARLAGQPAAFVYSYQHAGRVFGMRMGFDPSMGRSGLGTQLLLMLLRDSFARGDRAFEMGPGEQRYKKRLRTHVESTSRLVHVPETALKGQLVRATQWLGRKGRRLVKAAGR